MFSFLLLGNRRFGGANDNNESQSLVKVPNLDKAKTKKIISFHHLIKSKKLKNLISIILLLFICSTAMGQACGKYRVRIVGKLMIPENVELVKVPRISYLQNPSIETPEEIFIDVIPFQEQLSIELPSPLTSHLFDTPEELISFYKKNLDYYPLLILTKGEEQMEVKAEINWKDIRVKNIEDDGFGNLFEFNLGDIWVYFGNGEIGVEITNFNLSK
jgi:hypothetical protein